MYSLTAAAPLMFEIHNRLDPAPWLTQPTLGMKRVDVCRDDGFLADEQCERETDWVPADSHFNQQSPYHRLVHLDRTGRFQVDSSCEHVANMRHVAWFVLPPAEEFYFRRAHASYRELPPDRTDCTRSSVARRRAQTPAP